MHVLIISSEEFLPPHNKLDGIFQYHQGVILHRAGYRVGVLSVRLSFSVPMVVKASLFKLMGKKAGNAADDYGIGGLLKLGIKKLFKPALFVETEVVDGLTVYRIDGLYFRPPKNNQNQVSWVKAGLVCFEAYKRKEGVPDLIHAHNAVYAGLLAEEIKKRYGLKYVLTEHSSIYALNQVSEPVLKLVKKTYEEASGLYAVSQTFADFLGKKISTDRFRVLPNVLDKYLEDYPFRQPQTRNEKFVFLHIAVLLPVKDQKNLLEAFSRLLKKKPNAELWIGGGGELREKLEAQIASLNIGQSVKMLGVLERKQVIERLQACDCFVLSSVYETFGVVTIEAMLFGKPVITTHCGVGPSIVDEKVGFVVPVGDPEAMAEAMQKMMEREGTYDAAHIRQKVIGLFGEKKFLENINDAYAPFGVVPLSIKKPLAAAPQ